MLSFIKRTAILLGCSLVFLTLVSSFKVYATEDSIIRIDVSKNAEKDSAVLDLYAIDDEGFELTVSGNGEMRDLENLDFEALIDFCDRITSVRIESGITRIGENLFSPFYMVERIYIENPELPLLWSEDLMPRGAKIFAHNNSSAHSYAARFQRSFESICVFKDGICDKCEYECIAHKGGSADCKNRAVCEICGLSYGELSAHELLDFCPEILPTCTEDGNIGHYECGVCHALFNEEKKPIDSSLLKSSGHNYGEWIDFIPPLCESSGILGHYRCGVCCKYFDSEYQELQSVAIKETGHSGGRATCTEKAVCADCGKSYGTLNFENHIFSEELSFDDEYHYFLCLCGEFSDKTLHSYEKSVIREATNFEEGIIEYNCECGRKYRETVGRLEPTPRFDNTGKNTLIIKAVSVILIVLTSFAGIASITFLVLGLIKKKENKK